MNKNAPPLPGPLLHPMEEREKFGCGLWLLKVGPLSIGRAGLVWLGAPEPFPKSFNQDTIGVG